MESSPIKSPAPTGHARPAGGADLLEAKTLAQRGDAMTWAQRLRRVFKIDIETCNQCGGPIKVIACIEDLQS